MIIRIFVTFNTNSTLALALDEKKQWQGVTQDNKVSKKTEGFLTRCGQHTPPTH